MSIRREPTYLSYEVWRSLRLIAKAKSPVGEGDMSRIMTADQVADTLLREVIKELHPELLEHQKAVDKMEKQIIATIGGKKT